MFPGVPWKLARKGRGFPLQIRGALTHTAPTPTQQHPGRLQGWQPDAGINTLQETTEKKMEKYTKQRLSGAVPEMTI